MSIRWLGRLVVAVEAGGGVDDPLGSAPQGFTGSYGRLAMRLWGRGCGVTVWPQGPGGGLGPTSVS